MSSTTVSIPISETEKVGGILSIPEADVNGTGIVLAHGAGNDMTHPMMKLLAEGLADAGYVTLRFNFLYRDKGKKAPDKEDLLYAAWRGAHRFLAEHPEHRPKRIFAAGKSMGGRIASQMAAEGKLQVEGLIFLGYPLHPAGQKDRLRDAHLYDMATPMLFFAGTRDPLCDLELLRKVFTALKAPRHLEIVDGGDHSFNVPKSMGMTAEEVFRKILGNIVQWLEDSDRRGGIGDATSN